MLDPSSRGMSKQVMLDWMRINHPQTPIKSGITKAEVARLVRDMQPDFFPDPENEAPISDSTPGTRTPRISDSSTKSNDNLLSPNDDYSPAPLSGSVGPSPKLDTNTNIITKKKRPATNQLDSDQRLSKRPEIGNVTISADPSRIKKDKWRPKSGNPHRTLLMNGTSLNQIVPAKSMSKTISLTVVPQVSGKPLDDQYIPPLIDFSETDWLASPNPVVGHDIPPIEILPESESGKSSNKKSGVEVFKEERDRAQKIRELEESVEQLRDQLEMKVKSDMSILADEMRREEEVRLLQVRIADLELKVERIDPLQAIVKNLEAEVTRLCGKLSAAVEDIRAQEEVMTKLMNLEEVDEDSSDSGSINSSEI